MLTYRFSVPLDSIKSTRKAIESAAFGSRLRQRDLVGYLHKDRHAMIETAPALVLTNLIVSPSGAAKATLETLTGIEGQVVRHLARRLGSAECSFSLHRDSAGLPVGVDFTLDESVTQMRLRRVLSDAFDDAEDIAGWLLSKPIDPWDAKNGMTVVERAREIMRQQALAESA